jgi:hypothetical protein
MIVEEEEADEETLLAIEMSIMLVTTGAEVMEDPHKVKAAAAGIFHVPVTIPI